MNEQLLEPLHPDSTALVPSFRTNITAGMLRVIAEADYGEQADRCHEMLRPMLARGTPGTYDYALVEVLGLIRWSDPEIATWKPGIEGTPGHWIRLFACCALLQLEPIRQAHHGEDDTLAPFVESAIVLGEPVAQAAASVLAARFLAYPGDSRAYFALAVLLLAVHRQHRPPKGAWLHRLANWVEEEELQASYGDSGDPWLFGPVYPVQEGRWRRLVHAMLSSPKTHPPEADAPLRQIAAKVPLVRPGLPQA